MNKFRSLNSPYNSLGHSLQRVHCIILLKENLDESKPFVIFTSRTYQNQ